MRWIDWGLAALLLSGCVSSGEPGGGAAAAPQDPATRAYLDRVAETFGPEEPVEPAKPGRRVQRFKVTLLIEADGEISSVKVRPRPDLPFEMHIIQAFRSRSPLPPPPPGVQTPVTATVGLTYGDRLCRSNRFITLSSADMDC
ncbi:hypothetical protein [Inquilinus sp. Marseille-Q2685]|uniref:hypothetical protein n=1 Tax=Inquilinus sp. Marseille-Q2685 TaxID=2866581 RepID=UPI001CE3BABA|nr:hypothetical protein [Inquilinus sp. Marseille-Q2685]